MSLALQARGHVDFVRVRGEVHQRAFLEAEQRRARIAVVLVLLARRAARSGRCRGSSARTWRPAAR